ncbi:MAG TPA: HAD-IA family hydrolase [Balneolales bacterium]|nr:HAD-IA family hydrolase [Balneolales bacterium]
MSKVFINTLFIDIGGVLLTNGWDHTARRRAVEMFDLDYEEVDERHHLTFDTYEQGKLSLDDYLSRVIFYQNRIFTRDEFKDFMFSQSKPYDNMINYVRNLKQQFGLKVVAVSNEGRELNNYRISHFKLNEFIDAFVSSSYVHYRKPDKDIYRMALDIAQVTPEKSLYLDDREMFVQVANTMGIRGIHHKGYKNTCTTLSEMGLHLEGK